MNIPACAASPSDFCVQHVHRLFLCVGGRDANDIDLYSGALTETPVAGGIVGKTYACLLAKQFVKLRNCDRFWFETKDPVAGFDSGNK